MAERQNRWGKTEIVVDRIATKDAIEKFFKANKIAKPRGPWQDDGGMYAYDLTLIGYGIYSNSKKFRIYFDNQGGSKPFVQSNEEGEIDAKKLVAKATEAFAEYESHGNRERATRAKNDYREKIAQELSTKLEGTGFRASSEYRSIKISASFYSNEDAIEFAENLIKSLKK